MEECGLSSLAPNSEACCDGFLEVLKKYTFFFKPSKKGFESY